MRTLKPALLGMLLGFLGCTASSVLLAQSSGSAGAGDRAGVPGNRDEGMRERCNTLNGIDRERCFTELRNDERNRMGDRWPAASIGPSPMARGRIAGREPEGARFSAG